MFFKNTKIWDVTTSSHLYKPESTFKPEFVSHAHSRYIKQSFEENKKNTVCDKTPFLTMILIFCLNSQIKLSSSSLK